MDRKIVYLGAIPYDTDVLTPQVNAMKAIAMLAQAVLGTSTVADGLAVTQSSPTGLTVTVGPGSIYFQTSVDANAFGSLPADTTDLIMKQGINIASTILSTPAIGTAGQSTNYLIEAAFSEVDGNSTPLPYYNAANPSTPLNGPGGTGTPQNTTRTATVVLTAKAGTPATTGTQTTPALDANNIGLAVVTVASGASQVLNANISAYPNAPVIPSGSKLPNIAASLQSQVSNYSTDTGAANAYVATLTPAPTSWASLIGTPIRFKVANQNTSTACTLNVNGLGAKALINSDGSLPTPGSLSTGAIIEGIYDGNNVQIARGGSLQFAQCRLTFVSATSIMLAPFGGNRLFNPASGNQTIPSGGITAANTGVYVGGVASQNLAASTKYLIYEFNNAGVPTLDFWTTAWTTDTISGMPIRTGDNTRVLVGQVTTNASSQFTSGNVLSWWNRATRSFQISTSGSIGTLTPTATSASLSVSTWADESVIINSAGSGSNSTGGDGGVLVAYVDTALQTGTGIADGQSSSAGVGFGCSSCWAGNLSEGAHTIAVYAYTAIGGTFTYNSNGLSVTIRG